jgi:hypothetical protein
VVDGRELDGRKEAGEGVECLGLCAVSGKEDAIVRRLLDKGVGCIAICADGGEADGAVGIGDVLGRSDGDGA